MEDYDEGFARNLTTLFGLDPDLYRDLAGKALCSVALDDSKESLTLSFEDGSTAVFGVEGDCCSTSWIEHLTVPESLQGRRIVSIDDHRVGQERDDDRDTLLQSYSHSFVLDNGESIILEYRNESNGYYGGYLVRIR